MNPNQFTQTNNPVATFGENSQSVRDLQTQLNSQGANLKVDGLFGEKTRAAQGQFASAGEPVVASELEPELPVSSFVAPTGQIEDRETLRLRRDQERLLNRRQKSDDEIRRDTLRQFQGQIDATNNIFADELGRAKLAGSGRLGSQTAMSARRGLLGSDFGESQIQGRENENEQVFQGIENARNAKVQFLLGQARTDASAAILAKNQALSGNLDARLAFRNEAESRKTNNTTKAVRSILNQGFDIGQLQKGELQQLASFYGISTEDITNNFADEKRAFDAEQLAPQGEQFTLGEGQNRFDAAGNLIASGGIKVSSEPASIQEYRLAQSEGYDGTFTDFNKKQSSGLTPYQQFQATQSISKDNAARTTGARELERQSGIITATYDRFARGEAGDLNGTTQAIVTTFNKLLDPTSVVRESEYDRSSAGQALVSNIQGKIAAITQGGPGLTQASLKELVDLGNLYAENARASILRENERSIGLAESFGIDPSFVTSGGFQQEQKPRTLQDVYNISTPEQIKSIELLITENPQLTESDILQISGFNNVGNTIASNPQNLGMAMNFIAQEEGFREQAYQDQTGKWTIGFGTTVINGRPVGPGDTLSRQESQKVMRDQIVNSYTSFANKVGNNISPNQFAALTSFEYNLGSNVWNQPSGQKIIKSINQGNFQQAGQLMQQFNKSRNPSSGQLGFNKGLANRRRKEAELLIT